MKVTGKYPKVQNTNESFEKCKNENEIVADIVVDSMRSENSPNSS